MMRKQIPSVFGSFKKFQAGFSLIEIIVAMLIVGIMATISIPRFVRVGATATDQFVIALNNLNQTAVQQAYETHHIQKVIFDFQQNYVKIEKGESIEIPSYIEIDNLSIVGKPEYTTGQAYYLINDQGLAQEVKFDIINTENQSMQTAILNPFSAQFRLV